MGMAFGLCTPRGQYSLASFFIYLFKNIFSIKISKM